MVLGLVFLYRLEHYKGSFNYEFSQCKASWYNDLFVPLLELSNVRHNYLMH
jgi:hypothetical protein